MNGRVSGEYVRQPGGYRAFVPRPLPPEPPLEIDLAFVRQLSEADQALGRLDGITQTLPNPDLFVAMYVRREAVLSSQIEGTQSTLDDLLRFELDPGVTGIPLDVDEVVNYVRAMNYGLDRLSALPLSLRLIREIHAELLRGARGSDRRPGEFRAEQNWIGPESAPLTRATFVPPPPSELQAALTNLELFLHQPGELPPLIHSAIAHAQFETIHPFVDGNGRVGRLLITFLLVHGGVLHRPLLYLSYFLKRNRAEYYDRLMAIREAGDWEGWVRFFVRGVAETATEAADTARAILSLGEKHRQLVEEKKLGLNGIRLLDLLFERPLINVNLASTRLGVAFVTANKLIEQFGHLHLLDEITGGTRNRVFRYSPYLAVFEEVPPVPGQQAPLQNTGVATSARSRQQM